MAGSDRSRSRREDQEPGKEQKQETGLSPQTVLHFHHVLHEALKTAVKWGLLPVNPADAVSPPKVTRQDPHVLTEEQTAALLRAAEGTSHLCACRARCRLGTPPG